MTKEPGKPAPPKAVVVGVGDELLQGHTVDSNGSWLSRRLSGMGFHILRRWVVADGVEDIQEAVARGMDGTDLVLLTGGLGPTPDDITRLAVADLFGVTLEEDLGLVARLEDRFRARGFDSLPSNNRKMAQVPSGATLLTNPHGAAPGLALEGEEGGLVVLLPGPPREMRGTFEQGVRPFLRERFGERLAPIYHRVIHTTGIPESLLAEKIETLLPRELGPVTLAYLPDLMGVRLRFTVRGLPEGEAGILVDRVLDPLHDLLSPFRIHAPSGDLAEALGIALLDSGATLAVAESCTGGLIGKRITDHPGASRYFLGGILAYENRIKIEQLGVSSDLLDAQGAVSKGVAEAMARGVAERFGAEAGLGITGIAGPEGGTPEKPVGTVWMAASFRGRSVSKRECFPGDRENVRERGAQSAMALLYALLREETR